MWADAGGDGWVASWHEFGGDQVIVVDEVASVGDVSLHADRIDGGSERTVVLLHGLTQQRRFWGPVIARLCGDDAHPRILAVDLRGHGDSDKPATGPYDVPTCAADVIALLDSQSIDSAVTLH